MGEGEWDWDRGIAGDNIVYQQGVSPSVELTRHSPISEERLRRSR